MILAINFDEVEHKTIIVYGNMFTIVHCTTQVHIYSQFPLSILIIQWKRVWNKNGNH